MKLTTNQPGDREEIKRLFTKTFTESEGQSEGLLIGNLANDLITSTPPQDYFCFIAIENERIVGSIIFSRLRLERDLTAFLLGPVAVLPGNQGKGIGQALINDGLSTLKDHGVELAFVYGDPNFYAKVGFHPISEKRVKAPLKLTYPQGWLAQSLVGDDIEPIPGRPECVDAINKPEYW